MQFTSLSESKLSTPSLSAKKMQVPTIDATMTPVIIPVRGLVEESESKESLAV